MTQPSDFIFCALGGLGEIGMNMTLYGYGPKGDRQWLMVDCGISFAGPEQPGIDLIMPDIRFIEMQKSRLVGIVLTHAHEDHYGALIHLWPRLQAPVYATRFSAALLQAKKLSDPGAPPIDIRVVPSRARFDLGSFNIEMIDVAHSIPEPNALAIRTPAGTVLHTGDWKIDPTPTIPPVTDEARLKEIGAEGVLALIGDSTNAIKAGHSPSERDVSASLAEIIRERKGRVAITTFASNVGRIRSIAEAAMETGRSVVLVGRAMDQISQVARECGLLDGIPPFLSPENYPHLPRDKVVVILTGSQGESRAALARVAYRDHPMIELVIGDTVIFSSRTIPGNEKTVGDVINGLVMQGVEVLTDRDRLVHVSGHPRQGELAELYAWVKPRIAIPVHGEALHLHEHAKLARSLGVPQVIVPREGDVVLLGPGPARVIEEAPSGKLFLDGEILISASEETVLERRKLMFSGSVVIALALSEKGDILAEPDVKLTGLPPRTRDGRAMEDFIAEAALELLENLSHTKRRDPDLVETVIERGVRNQVRRVWGKKPVCKAIVLVV